MTLLLGLLIGLAIGFSLGVYTCRRSEVNRYESRFERWRKETERAIALQLDQFTQRANSQLLDEILRKLQADLEGFKLHISESLSESYQNFLQRLADYTSQLVKNISNQQNILGSLSESIENISQNLNSSSSLQKGKETNKQTADARLKSLPPETISREQVKIGVFLWSKNIRMKNLLPSSKKAAEGELDNKLNWISNLMGQRYSMIEKLYKEIKSGIGEEKSLTLCLKGNPPEVINYSCQLASTLRKVNFLKEHNYSKSSKTLMVKLSKSSEAIKFLSGDWLERYVKQQLIKFAREQGQKIDFSYIANAEVTLPNGSDFEIDLFFHINNRFYWIESKTGSYRDCIEKYSWLASEMGLGPDQVFLVLADADQETRSRISSSYNLSAISVEEVESLLYRIVRR
ncbi:hypothetical protein NW845_11080 [Synechococcus sp. H60.2]|uniref:hypothetical protein n=1 Tax=Synechococcus sp. H60.2 TaxID=2964518 RepID=UPI0039C3A076